MPLTDRVLAEVPADRRSAALRLAASSPRTLLIGGTWRAAESGQTISTVDPSTGAVIAEVAAAGPADVNLAVEAALAGQAGSWSSLPPNERAQLLWRIGQLILDHGEELALLESLDAGKPLRKTRLIDVRQCAAHFFYQAGACQRLTGTTIPVSRKDHLVYTLRKPIGVVAAITPWNYPLIMAARNIAPALAAGNCVVHKPAEETPLTALRLGQLIYEAGLPEGVLSVVPGIGEQAGAALAAHPQVRKLSFTGGQSAARAIALAATGNFKRLTLELGGKAPMIIFADADLEMALDAAIDGGFGNTGQDCSAAARIYVQQDIYEEFTDALRTRVRDVNVGDPFDLDTDVGPLISQVQRLSVEAHLAAAVGEGATVVNGGTRPSAALAAGTFLDATLVHGATDDMAITRDEVFGPVVVPYAFTSTEEVVARANANHYGLAAGLWTRDVRRAHRVAAQLSAGTVWINTWERFDPAAPFGGVKESGYGRDMGEEALHENTELVTIWTALS